MCVSRTRHERKTSLGVDGIAAAWAGDGVLLCVGSDDVDMLPHAVLTNDVGARSGDEGCVFWDLFQADRADGGGCIGGGGSNGDWWGRYAVLGEGETMSVSGIIVAEKKGLLKGICEGLIYGACGRVRRR